MIACRFLAGDLVGVDLSLRHLLSRLAVGEKLDRERRVDRETELQRGKHQLGAGAGHDRLLRHRAEHQLGLVGAAALGVDEQRAPLYGDAALVQAQQVIAVGLKALLAAGIEEAECLRREAPIGVGLAEAAGVGAADQGGEAPRSDPRALQIAEHPLEDPLLRGPQRRDSAAAEATRLLKSGVLGQGAPERRGAVEQATEWVCAARRAETNGEVDLWAQRAAALELGAVFGEVALEALAPAMTGVKRGKRPALIAPGVKGAGDAEDLEVGLQGVGERLQALAYFNLARVRKAGVALALELIDRPGVSRSAEDQIGPEEVVRRPHSGATLGVEDHGATGGDLQRLAPVQGRPTGRAKAPAPRRRRPLAPRRAPPARHSFELDLHRVAQQHPGGADQAPARVVAAARDRAPAPAGEAAPNRHLAAGSGARRRARGAEETRRRGPPAPGAASARRSPSARAPRRRRSASPAAAARAARRRSARLPAAAAPARQPPPGRQTSSQEGAAQDRWATGSASPGCGRCASAAGRRAGRSAPPCGWAQRASPDPISTHAKRRA